MNSEPPSLSMDIAANDAALEGALDCPSNVTGLVTLAHGSGSSWLSSRNRYVIDQPHAAGLGTLSFDLSSIEGAPHVLRHFDIALPAYRPQGVIHATDSVARERSLQLGYFGASTGAAIAILTAFELDDACTIKAVTNRGDRPDFASRCALVRLACPTLLVVGAADLDVPDLSRQALSQMHCEKMLETAPRVTYLSEEADVLEQVIGLAWAWFVHHLSAAAQSHQHAG